jgi:hypothetical protein
MGIVLQEVEYGKEDGRKKDNADNHAGGAGDVEKDNHSGRECIGDHIGNEDPDDEDDDVFYRPRFHTSTGKQAYKTPVPGGPGRGSQKTLMHLLSITGYD